MRVNTALAFVAILCMTVCCNHVWADPHLIEYHSFKPPFENEGQMHVVPEWIYDGALASRDEIILTEQRQSVTGSLWNVIHSTMLDWQVEFSFQVNGGPTLGGDGFAWWYVERPHMFGPVYGSADYWNGLGVFFDSFNNDGVGPSPIIMAVVNDGTKNFDYATDGRHSAAAYCEMDFRNNGQPGWVRIVYQGHRLVIDVALRTDPDGNPIYEPCLQIPDLVLGVDKYFGLTAHTGEVADRHRVFEHRTIDLTDLSVDEDIDARLDKARQEYRESMIKQMNEGGNYYQSDTEILNAVLTGVHQLQDVASIIDSYQESHTQSLDTIRSSLAVEGTRFEDLQESIKSINENIERLLTRQSVGDTQTNSGKAVATSNDLGAEVTAQVVSALTSVVERAVKSAVDEAQNDNQRRLDRLESSIRGALDGVSCGGGGGGGGGGGMVQWLILIVLVVVVLILAKLWQLHKQSADGWKLS